MVTNVNNKHTRSINRPRVHCQSNCDGHICDCDDDVCGLGQKS